MRWCSWSRVWALALALCALVLPDAASAATKKPPPSISAFEMDALEKLAPGEELFFRLQGTPGARATVRVTGVSRTIVLQEVDDGTYEGSYALRRNDKPQPRSTVTALLRKNGLSTTSRIPFVGPTAVAVAPQPPAPPAQAQPRADARPPQIHNLTPRDGAVLPDNVQVVISGSFDDQGGLGVDPTSVRLVVAGRDVTRDATITGDHFIYRAELPPGSHAASITARDLAGNEARNAWSFQVQPSAIGAGTSAPTASFPLEITSHAPNAAVEPGRRVTVRGRTAPYATLDVEVIGLAPVVGALGMSHKLLNQRINADRQGDFSFEFAPPAASVPGMRYEVEVRASQGGQLRDHRLVLFAQR